MNYHCYSIQCFSEEQEDERDMAAEDCMTHCWSGSKDRMAAALTAAERSFVGTGMTLAMKQAADTEDGIVAAAVVDGSKGHTDREVWALHNAAFEAGLECTNCNS